MRHHRNCPASANDGAPKKDLADASIGSETGNFDLFVQIGAAFLPRLTSLEQSAHPARRSSVSSYFSSSAGGFA